MGKKTDTLWDTFSETEFAVVGAAITFAAEHDPLLHDSDEGLDLHEALDAHKRAYEALDKIGEFDPPVAKTAVTAV